MTRSRYMTAWGLRSAALVGIGFGFMEVVRYGLTTLGLVVLILSAIAGTAHVLIKG